MGAAGAPLAQRDSVAPESAHWWWAAVAAVYVSVCTVSCRLVKSRERGAAWRTAQRLRLFPGSSIELVS